MCRLLKVNARLKMTYLGHTTMALIFVRIYRSDGRTKRAMHASIFVTVRFFTAALLCLATRTDYAAAQAVDPKKSPKVVVVSLDAAADWLVDEFLARGVLPAEGAFARMSRSGVRAEAMIPINVASTSPSHIAMFTGAYPERTGIVANTFLQPGDAVGRGSSGFNAPIKAEALWSAAIRQGKRVICATAVGADNASPDRSATMTFGYARQEVRPSVVWLTPSTDDKWQYGGKRIEHARALAVSANSPGQLEYKFKSTAVPLYALAVDRSFDGKEIFDAIALDRDRNLSNGYVGALEEGDWAPTEFSIDGHRLGSWIRCLNLKADLSEAVVYLGAVGSNPGGPAEFVGEIETKIGFWPGEVDNPNQNRGLIDEQVWFEQVERLTGYIKNLTLFNFKQPEWDLLFTYFPILDDIEHRYLLRDPRQADYDAEDGQRRERYARRVEWAYQQIDKTLKELMDAAPPETNFIVVSDHGMVPTHTAIMINNFLAESGFKVDPEDQAEVRAQADGASAHIYVNLVGRQKGGIIPREKLDHYVDRIVSACRSLRDPRTNDPIFHVVLKRSELDQLRLNDAERAGDVFVSARPGWSLSPRVLPEVPVFVSTTFRPDTRKRVAGNKQTEEFLLTGGANETGLGVHGHISAHREIQAIFFAFGPNVPARLTGPVNGVDLAPTVASLLGIEPPRDAQGKSIFTPVY
jgi:predicted AlkP superfamily pyrophosphatase or phosphodiesterase